MSKKRVSWFPYRREYKQKLLALCSINRYRICTPKELTGILPAKLLDRADSGLVIASQISNGDVMVMINLNRIDWDKGRMVFDQQPCGFYFSQQSNDYTQPSGCVVHHPQWDGRTSHQPELPEKRTGSIDELTIESQHKAFQKICSLLIK